MIRVAVIDDHFLVRVGLQAVVGVHPDIEFCGESESAADIVGFVDKVRPDVLLLDIRMSERDGIDALAELLEKRPAQKVLMLTTSEADNDVYQALSLGAKGYLLKDRDSLVLVDAIRRVAEGGKYIPDAVRELYRNRQMTPELTPREESVLALVVKGLGNDEIASSLGISYQVVKYHVSQIFIKLGVRDRAQLVGEALRRGFAKPS